MGLPDLQSYIVQSIPDATELVDLLKIADKRSREQGLRLVVDGEFCLDRLYGGYYPDWVCGGQWNKMEQYLRNFATAVQKSKLELILFLNGSLESERLIDWCKRQEETYKFLQEIHQHVTLKKKPPPKIWWIPPSFLRSSLRLAFRILNMKIMCSLEDHRKDIVRFMKKNHINGIIADDSEYLIFEPSRYFSAQKLKLTFKGSLETVEMKLTRVFSVLDIPKDRLRIFATLLGNHILPETDLNAFYGSLNIQDSQKTNVIETLAQFVRNLEKCSTEQIVDLILEKSKPQEAETQNGEIMISLRDRIQRSLLYYDSVNRKSSPNRVIKSVQKQSQQNTEKSDIVQNGNTEHGSPSIEPEVSLPSDKQNLDNAKVFEESDSVLPNSSSVESSNDEKQDILTKESIVPKSEGSTVHSVKPKSMQVSCSSRKHWVPHQIETVAVNRHRAGLMSPYICQIVKYNEIKLPLIIQDIKQAAELPATHLIFRPLRQRVYAILFNLHHLHFLAKQNGEAVPKIEVKETYYDLVSKTLKTDTVRAVEVGWGVPTVERLWLGEGDECKRKRIRAFLSIMKSDKQTLLEPSIVPQNFLVLSCVLRYLMCEKKVFRQYELDAFILQAMIQQLTDPSVAQDIEVSNLTMRGVHLSHLFMEGVEMAMFVNDSCGSPIPYMLFAPWLFFNGKIFNFILEELVSGKSINEISGFKMEISYNLERLKAVILDGINVQFATNPYHCIVQTPISLPLFNQILPGQFPGVIYDHNQSANNSSANRTASTLPSRRNVGGLNVNPPVLRNPTVRINPPVGVSNHYGNGSFLSQIPPGISRNFPASVTLDRRISNRNAQLQIAGTVVGSWGDNYSQPSFPRNIEAVTTCFPTRVSSNHVRRNLPNSYVVQSPQLQSEYNSRHVRVSYENEVPINSSTNWNSGTRRAQKSIMKKNDVSNSRSENCSSSFQSKRKGVSFCNHGSFSSEGNKGKFHNY